MQLTCKIGHEQSLVMAFLTRASRDSSLPGAWAHYLSAHAVCFSTSTLAALLIETAWGDTDIDLPWPILHIDSKHAC